MGRPSTGRERLLDAACQLMRTRSYSTVGVAEICATADVRKGSFYHFFPSKQELTLAAVDAHWTEQRAAWAATLSAPRPALDRLRQLLIDTAATYRQARDRSGTLHGCVLANLALELSADDTLVRARLREIFADQVTLIGATLADAAAEDAIVPAIANPITARAIVAQLEGMVMFAKIDNDPAPLDDLWAHTRLLLGLRPVLT